MAIHRAFRPPEEFSPDLHRRRAHLPRAIPGLLWSMARLWYNRFTAAGAMSVTLTNAEKQARYRERHLGVDGARRWASDSISTPAPRPKMGRLARRQGYTITVLVDETGRTRRTAGDGKAALPRSRPNIDA
jgi:hypothetical protein